MKDVFHPTTVTFRLSAAALLTVCAACSKGSHARTTAPPASAPVSAPAASPPVPPSKPPVPVPAGQTRELRRMTAGGAEVTPPAGSAVSITFEPNGDVRGYSGVNTFRGGYVRDGSSLAWATPFSSTRRGGSPEARFLQVLEDCGKAEDTAEGGLKLSGAAGELDFGPTKPFER